MSLVRVYRPGNLADLLAAKAALTGAGLRYLVPNEYGGVGEPILSSGAVHISVREEDVEAAVIALAELLLAQRSPPEST